MTSCCTRNVVTRRILSPPSRACVQDWLREEDCSWIAGELGRTNLQRLCHEHSRSVRCYVRREILPIGDVPSMRRDLPLVTARISRDLFLADLDLHEQRMNGTMPADFSPDLYAASVWKP